MSHTPQKRKNLYKLILGFCQNLFFSFRGFHQGMLHWYPALLVHKGQGIYGPTPNFFPEQRITYQDLHGFSQSFYHLFIIFILLLRLGQKSRELSYPEEKSTALSAGQPTDADRATIQHTPAQTQTLPLQPSRSPGRPQPLHSLNSIGCSSLELGRSQKPLRHMQGFTTSQGWNTCLGV